MKMGPRNHTNHIIGNIFVPQLKKSDCGLIKGEFVNTMQSSSRLVYVKSCVWLFTPARHTCHARAGEIPLPFSVCKFDVEFFSSVTQVDQLKLRVNLQSYMNKPRSTLVFTNLPSTSPQSDFFGWCIFRFFFCIADMLNYGISLVFWGPFSLKTHLEVSSHARTRQVREQSSL